MVEACVICSKEFNYSCLLNVNMKTHNKDIIRFSRNYCCIKLRHNQNLKIHKKTVNKEVI